MASAAAAFAPNEATVAAERRVTGTPLTAKLHADTAATTSSRSRATTVGSVRRAGPADASIARAGSHRSSGSAGRRSAAEDGHDREHGRREQRHVDAERGAVEEQVGDDAGGERAEHGAPGDSGFHGSSGLAGHPGRGASLDGRLTDDAGPRHVARPDRTSGGRTPCTSSGRRRCAGHSLRITACWPRSGRVRGADLVPVCFSIVDDWLAVPDRLGQAQGLDRARAEFGTSSATRARPCSSSTGIPRIGPGCGGSGFSLRHSAASDAPRERARGRPATALPAVPGRAIHGGPRVPHRARRAAGAPPRRDPAPLDVDGVPAEQRDDAPIRPEAIALEPGAHAASGARTARGSGASHGGPRGRRPARHPAAGARTAGTSRRSTGRCREPSSAGRRSRHHRGRRGHGSALSRRPPSSPDR